MSFTNHVHVHVAAPAALPGPGWHATMAANVTVAAAGGVESHEKESVRAQQVELQHLRAYLNMKTTVWARSVADDFVCGENEKVVYLVRHGEGAHNVAQREWKDAGKAGEPYTLANDPDLKFQDAQLTSVGCGQARALRTRVAALPEKPFVVVSPMRRATQTALLALPEPKDYKIAAHESCHETGGMHTCDRRIDIAGLRFAFPGVDYDHILADRDPLWSATAREAPLSVAARAVALCDWLRERPEKRVAVFAHSGFLLALCNAVLTTVDEPTRTWFGTGEMRALALTWVDP